MLKQSLRWLCIVGLLASPASALDLSRIDRSIRREPCYQAQPKYALLVLGQEARTHVWLVLDHNLLYVDRNANGDLTEADERFWVDGTSSNPNISTWFRVPDITEPDGTQHTNLALSRLANDEFRMSILVR